MCIRDASFSLSAEEPEEEPPNVLADYDDLDEDELAEMAIERELLEGLTAEEIFSLSDLEDFPTQDDEDDDDDVPSQSMRKVSLSQDVDMDMN